MSASDRASGKAWANGLRMDQIHALIDDFVLGTFDWRDWLDRKPSRGFTNGAFDAAQSREEAE